MSLIWELKNPQAETTGLLHQAIRDGQLHRGHTPANSTVAKPTSIVNRPKSEKKTPQPLRNRFRTSGVMLHVASTCKPKEGTVIL